MTTTVRLWLSAAHDAAHRSGGWAFVQANGAESVGWAGGERRTTRPRMALAAFVAALKDVPPGAALAVVATRPEALVLHTLLKPPVEPPADDLDLRAQLAAALAGRTWTLAVGDPKSASPIAFAHAWAELGRDKALAKGPFASAIPKTNLANVKGL